MQDFSVREAHVDDAIIDELYVKNSARISTGLPVPPVNTYVNFRGATNHKKTVLLRHLGEDRYIIRQNSSNLGCGISPKGLNQAAFVMPSVTQRYLLTFALVLREPERQHWRLLMH